VINNDATTVARGRRDRTHYLYILVIVGVLAGIAVGFVAPGFAKSLKPLGDGFVALIRMMIPPVVFCTIVLGIGKVRRAAQVGKVGGLALVYFLIMSSIALLLGLIVGNFLHPGEGLRLTPEISNTGTKQAAGTSEDVPSFLLGIIPKTLLSSLTEGQVLQALLVALLVGFAIQALGRQGEPILRGVEHIQRLVFKVLLMVMWVAPIGAFGAIAAVVGTTGINALKSLAVILLGFYITCIVFIFGILGGVLWVVARVSIFSLLRYLGRELLLVFSASSSEVALPRLIAKMEHLGVSRPVVGITVPTGYSFNLDGIAIYLTMASLFIASALGKPMSIPEQVGLLLFMIVASKGGAGVTGAGLASLAAGLQGFRPDLLPGVGFIVGIDRFMSEARALTSFIGNAVAAVLVGAWCKEVDHDQMRKVLTRRAPFNEATLVDEAQPPATAEPATAS
jgi:aerobic C4-dicarboxylate transport protein